MASILILLFASVVAVHQGISLKHWFISAAIYGLLSCVIFGWSWSECAIYELFLGMGILLWMQSSWLSYITHFFYKNLSQFIPKLSPTEEEALQVGDAWLEKMIFQGNIDWDKLKKSNTQLTEEEQKFLDEETQELCGLLNEWDISQQKDLSPKVWQFIKDKGFLGMVISKAYGGKGFSARAHSDVVLKVASRSAVAAVTVMVPNSLGPGELLMHYGTESQKDYYLPRLSKGIDIPCFALTEPEAGSDATSIQSKAVVCYENQVLGMKLTLEKRWITLAPIATLIGVAVNLRDPDGLLKGVGQEGITCILIERETDGLIIGPRHLPANQPFMNGTIRGKDIFVPIENIIGGQAQAGHGWKMLVECLSVGRSISLPALATASSGVSYLTAGAFARLRRQFNTEVVNFEGIQEKLASIAGLHYLVNANRLMTLAAVDAGKKPAVASAIAKYFNTELARQAINDAMDVHGGRAVVEGPRNYLINYYQGIPISITVEGANIMSRNLLIFGQGSMVCHPFVKEEFYAIRNKDPKAFHQAFVGHAQYFITNFCKAWVSSWTGGLLSTVDKNKAMYQPHVLIRLSYAFAWIADFALITLGGDLKRKERLSARLADAFSYLYMALAVFGDLERESSKDELTETQAQWALQFSYAKAQSALIGFIREYPIRPLAWIMKMIVAPFGQTYQYPKDRLETKLAFAMTKNYEYRQRIKDMIFLSQNPQEPIDRIEQALQQFYQLETVYSKVPDIRKYKFHEVEKWLDSQVKAKIITAADKKAILAAEAARYDALQVDEFEMSEKKSPVFNVL
ncbi:MAG: acyl-CoA dehydrogenase [Gammaproteobacteria bacterium]|nr:acyl-CoA dehydrogenase [Gammaproteobacteria bacterium]